MVLSSHSPCECHCPIALKQREVLSKVVWLDLVLGMGVFGPAFKRRGPNSILSELGAHQGGHATAHFFLEGS